MTTVTCGRCRQVFDGLPGDEHGPVVRLLAHWKSFHTSRLAGGMFEDFLHSVGYGYLGEEERAS